MQIHPIGVNDHFEKVNRAKAVIFFGNEEVYSWGMPAKLDLNLKQWTLISQGVKGRNIP